MRCMKETKSSDDRELGGFIVEMGCSGEDPEKLAFDVIPERWE